MGIPCHFHFKILLGMINHTTHRGILRVRFLHVGESFNLPIFRVNVEDVLSKQASNGAKLQRLGLALSPYNCRILTLYKAVGVVWELLRLSEFC